MNLVFRALAVLVAAGVITSTVAFAGPVEEWRFKVDEVLLDRMDDALVTGTALDEYEFLIVLVEQADLSVAAGMQTKNQKGTFVFESLREVATRTQRNRISAATLYHGETLGQHPAPQYLGSERSPQPAQGREQHYEAKIKRGS